MSPSRFLIRKFTRRRSSQTETPKSKLLPSSASILSSPPARPEMLSLPTELHARILENVSLTDLCAFRATCRTTCRLLCSGEIIRRWLDVNGNNKLQLSLYPPPNPPSFQYVLAQRWRYRLADKTAEMLAYYIQREVLQYTLLRLDVYPTRDRDEVLQSATKQVHERLIPLVLTLQHYLEHFAEMLLDEFGPLQNGKPQSSFRSERDIFESYDPQHLLQVHKFWLFLWWLLNRVLTQRGEGGRARAAACGTVTEPHSRYQLRLMLVLGNSTALMAVLSQDTPKQRLKAMATWLRRLDPDLSLVWQRRWQENVLSRNLPSLASGVRSVLKLRLSAAEIWANGAITVLKDKGLLPKCTGEDIGAPWQALDFLCDVAGYDALQTTPSLLHLSRAFMRPAHRQSI